MITRGRLACNQDERPYAICYHDFLDTDLGAQCAAASRRVVAHYRETGGELAIWGTIQRYLFQYAKEAVLIFDTAGRAIGETDRIRAGRATATVGGHDVSGVVSVSDQTEPNTADDSYSPLNRPH